MKELTTNETNKDFSIGIKLVLGLVMVLVWLPFLWLSFYNVPIGMHEWDWMTREAGTLPVDWFETQMKFYNEVMGRYTSTAILSLTHIWCRPGNFPWFFLIWQIGWGLTLYYLVNVLFTRSSLFLGALMAFGIQSIYISQMEDVYDTMFRYTGVLTYQLGFLLAGWALICFVKDHNRNGLFNKLTGFLLLALVVGTNEISMILCLLVGLIVFFNERLNGGIRKVLGWQGLTLIAFCAAIVILAPGNGERVVTEKGTLPLAEWIQVTIGATLYVWVDWLSDTHLLLITLLFVPLLVAKRNTLDRVGLFNNYKPWLLALILSVPVSLGLLLYAAGSNAFPERVIDHLFIHVIFIWFGTAISLAKRINPGDSFFLFGKPGLFRVGYGVCALYVILNIFGEGLGIDRTHKYANDQYLELIQSRSNVSNAWLVLLSGKASAYHQQSISELDKLINCQEDTCYMKKPVVIPEQLYDPLSDRRNRGGDPFMGYYFNPRIKRVLYSGD